MTDIEPEVIEAPEVEEEVIDQPEAEEAEEETGLVVNLEGEDEEADTPDWVNHLRRENRELKKWRKEQEAKAASTVAVQMLRPEPTLEGHDFDEAAFTADHKKWVREEIEFEKRDAERKSVQEKAEQRWQQKLSFYDEGKSKLGAQDYEDAEATVNEILSAPFPGIMADDVRMGIIKQGAKDPAALVYALGKNPAKAKELAAIDDPVEFAWKASALEAGMKINRGGGKAPTPEKRIGGGSAPGVTATNDRTLDALLATAEKTGDYSKVAAYKRAARK
jgi:hypothetical protein